MSSLLAAVVVLIPLVITPGVLFYFDLTPKIAILLIGTAIGILMLLRQRQGPEVRRCPAIVKWFAVILGIQAISLLIGTVWSTNWELSLMGTNWRRFGLLTHLAVLGFAFLVTIAVAGRPDRMR